MSEQNAEPNSSGKAARSSERGRRPSGGERAGASDRRRRWWPQRKDEVVLRLLHGESLDAVSRAVGKPASELARWREEFLRGGGEAMKSRAGDPAFEASEEDRRALRAKIGELTMDNELLRDKIHRMEAGRPPAWRRSSR